MASLIKSQLPEWVDLGAPTLDRPFGLAVWPIFAKGFEKVVGYDPLEFRFESGQLPLSTLRATVLVLISYYVVIFAGREVMRNFEPLKLNGIFKVHNFLLTIISFALLLLFAEQMIPTVVRHGVFHSICNSTGGWTRQLVVLYYLNYAVKYVELLDTCFLFLKKKPLTFLHTYHHGATALLCYTQLVGRTPVSWVPITANLAVHVVMYWYYFQSARGVRVWWKRYITIFQIFQFVVDIIFIYYASYNYFASTYQPDLLHAGRCDGEEFAAIAGIMIISSYLLLFISFYFATYMKPIAGGQGRAKSALLEMKDETIPTVGDARRRLSHGSNPLANGSTSSSEKVPNGRVTRSRKN